jgi:uncharacterized protein
MLTSTTRIDVAALAKAAAVLEGDIQAHELPRLQESVTSVTGAVSWSAMGSWKEAVGREPEIRLHLKASAQVVLTCQRCLEPMQETLTVDQTLRFVRDREAGRINRRRRCARTASAAGPCRLDRR